MRAPAGVSGCVVLALAAAGVACQPPVTSETPRMWEGATAASGIVQESVTFDAAAGPVKGLLARPADSSSHPAVIIVPGSWLVEPYIASTAAMLAQAGFAALAVDVFSFFPDVASYDDALKVPWEVTQDAIAAFSTDTRILDELAAGWRFLRAQPFVRAERTALIGFCGGGRDALVFAAAEPQVAATVLFYAPVKLGLSSRARLVDLAARVRTPIQAHYGLHDGGIPLEDVADLQRRLEEQATPVEVFRYPAGHGFFAYNRAEAFAPEQARLAWTRLVAFLSAHLN